MDTLGRPVARLGELVGQYPLRTAGALAALAGGAVTYAALGEAVTVGALLAFTLAHPAYPAAAVFGLAVLLFVDG